MSMIETTQIDVLASLPAIRASGVARPSKWLLDWARGDEADGGVRMNSEKALSYAPVVQAITVLAGDVGQLPLDLFRRIDERDREKDRSHYAYRIARRRANPFMSAATFRETLMLHALLYGNGVAEIERNNRKQAIALWPLLPQRTSREIVGGKVWYLTRVGEEPATRKIRLEAKDVIHISNFGTDGTWGYSTITMARNSWGLGLAGEKYANRYFNNNGVPSGTLEHPGLLSDDAYKRLRRDWRETHEGLDNAARLAILEEGAKYTPMAFNHKDSQWLESREFQREDVASWFNLPPHKLGVLKDANYSNMVEKNRDYLGTGLMRWLVKWQDEYDEKLLSAEEKTAESHFYEFNTDALLRADTKTRFEAYARALGGHPFLELNEVRAKENVNAVEGGDEIPEPLNMSTGKEAVEESKADDRVTAKITQLLSWEANRICHAGKAATNFVGWLDAFYDRWADTLSEAFLGLPGCLALEDPIRNWIAGHKKECLEIAGQVPQNQKDQLCAYLAAATAAWPAQIEQYANELKGSEDETC